MNKNELTKGHVLAFITIFIWGTTYISTKILLERFSPVEILFFRLVLAYIALLLLSPHMIKFKNWKEESMFMLLGLCGVTLYFVFQNTALTYTQAANVGVLVSVSPFFTAILSHFFLRDEKLSGRFFAGFLLSIAGIFLIGFNGNFILKLNPLGDILAVMAAFVWSVYSIIMKKMSANEYNTIQCTRKIFFYGMVFLLPVLYFSGFRLGLERFANIPDLLNLLFLGLAASALCYVTWNKALGILGAIKTSIYIYIIPIISITMSILVLHERITWVAAAGVLLILSGLYFSGDKTK